ncbi:aminotransferase-like domain-containing protein [Bordetella genomosp. 9]|uniref:GntR family transcriptional regulator n=1 Tax=Bordetella genomosp. 9 TaxID=1416803 RepID=A0A1W6YWM6_9BORD|nr:PLP-dependent aminotransferase family protein [Bordetella genomosp. 9]ARP85384.1 GntR family transcriptional regulator [Bordetella genomosp. 9]ARP89367.1 GntR family transcriptional regulator [Bordetella genomosp. 9]
MADDGKAARPGRPAPIAESLARLIAQQIADGVYRPGDKLPSLREVAQLHRYAKNTVVVAFEMLVAQGLVEPRRGSGFYVLDKHFARKPAEEESGQLSRAMDIVWLMREQLKTQPDAVAVGDGFPPVEWLADMRMDRYHQKVVRTGLGSLFRYGSRFGYAPLRESLVRKLGDIGVNAAPSQLVLTHGANEAMDLLIRYFLAPGAAVLVDDPGYYPLFGKLKLAGARMLGVPRLPDGPDLAALEQLLARFKPRLFFTQSLAHNPTGSDISAAKAYRLLQLCHSHGAMLVENDPLADFKPTSAVRLAALDQLARTIYIGSFSKSFSAALRVGFIACDPALASDLADLKALVHVSSSEYCERMVDVMLREGHYERHLFRLRRRLEAATAQALQVLDGLGAEVFARPASSLYLWTAFPGVADTVPLARDLIPEKILMAPGRVFSVDADKASRWSRCNVGAVLDERFGAALARRIGVALPAPPRGA